MGTKTISLDEEAYSRLKKEKAESESFSDVVKRITRPVKKKSILEFVGIWDLSAEEMVTLKTAIKDIEVEMDDMFR